MLRHKRPLSKGGGGSSGGKGRGGKKTQSERSAARLPSGVEVTDSNGLKKYDFTVGTENVQFKVYDGDKYTRNQDGAAQVSFNVGGGAARVLGKLSPREASVAALKIAKVMKYDALTRPDGFKYTTYAVMAGDNREATRALSYQSIGFSRPVSGSIGLDQYAVVKGGKLTPDNAKVQSMDRRTPARIEENMAGLRELRLKERRS